MFNLGLCRKMRKFRALRAGVSTIRRPEVPRCRGVREQHFSAVATRHKTAGFSLLETVVALAIFAAGAMALYGLFNTNLIALGRSQATAEHLPAARNAIEVLSTVNPWHQSEGAFEVDGFQVDWAAQLIQPIRHGQTNAGMMAGFDFGLYEIEFVITDGRRRLGVWRMRSVGYERIRGLPPGEDIL